MTAPERSSPRPRSVRARAGVTLGLALLLSGCGSGSGVNPSFPITKSEGYAALREMGDDPKPLERPLVIAAGYIDPGMVVDGLRRRIEPVFDEESDILVVTFFMALDLEACRDRLVEAVNHAFPSDDPAHTVEVDVIGFSMGGLVSKYAAQTDNGAQGRLRINRLFTIGTPHRGANLAWLTSFDARASAMQPRSSFLEDLAMTNGVSDYELVTYGRLGDQVVGIENSAPPDEWAWWVPTPPLELAHMGASNDPRILADIARRLRGEAPFTTEPRTPPPGFGSDEDD